MKRIRATLSAALPPLVAIAIALGWRSADEELYTPRRSPSGVCPETSSR
jgi:hypothetical protein